MSINSSVVRRIARLARIKVTDEEVISYEKELNSILNWIEQLQKVPTDGIEPLQSVVPTSLPRRKDVVTDGDIQEEVLKNAALSKYGCYAVPKVVE